MSREESLTEPPPTKKARSSPQNGVADEEAAAAPPPEYGSLNYWEQRYQKQLLKKDSANSQDVNGNNDNGKDDDDDDGVVPFHAWYFTYQDLRPLLLPLVLGGRQEARETMDEARAGDADDDEFVDSHYDSQSNSKEISPADKDGKQPEESDPPEDESDNEGEEKSDNEGEEKSDDDNKDNDDEEDEYEEVEFDEYEEEEVAVDRDGLADNGPISILEVGCGDVPLGADLALELQKLGRDNDCTSKGIIKQILCIDYSPTVIQAMQEQYLTKKQDDGDASAVDQLAPLAFSVEDARKMSFKDESFELILEKGTLDAMLSNKQEGVANCVNIVSECARVLSIGGYLVIISHLNAHTSNGIRWLEEVVHTGLRAGGGGAGWNIEVHGNDQISEEGNANAPAGSPGPAVYIIHKIKTPVTADKQSNEEEDAIPVNFFAYE
jgi:SAM-dependent methyltransferase